jgi:tetratricopeptide (TPR) repeat protein
MRKTATSPVGSALRTACAAIAVSAILPAIAAAQDCVPTSDPALRAATEAQRAGHIEEARKIVWDARQATEQSAPDSPKMALYLRRTAGMNGTDAITDLQRAMDIDTKAFGPNSCAVAQDLYAIAFAQQQTQPAETERILKQVIGLLDDSPEKLGMKSTTYAQLASLYVRQKRTAEATAAYEQAVRDCDLSKYIPGPCDSFREQLQRLYLDAGRTEEANRLRSFNPDERDFWQLEQLNRQGSDAEKGGLYPQAELIYRRGIEFIQQHPQHIFGVLGGQFDMLGRVLEKEGRDTEAEQAYLHGLEMMENAAGPKPPQSHYVESLPFHPLIDLYRRKGRLEEMEPLIQHGLEIQEKYLPPDNRRIYDTLEILAGIYRQEKKYTQAKAIYERILAVQEKNLGLDDPGLLPTLTSYADVLRSMHDDSALDAVQARINLLQLIQSRSVQQKKLN